MRRPLRRPYRTVADINIANLVDVVLVLLIIFMISAPLLQSGIEVNLPRTVSAAPQEQHEGIVISLDRKGGVYINDKWSRLDAFEAALTSEMKAKSNTSVYIRGDSSVAYGIAIEVISRIKNLGIEQIGLVTVPTDKSQKHQAKR